MATCPKCGFKFTVYRARTTGPGSQCNHLHGHLQQLAEHTGHSMGEIKEAMKADLMEWPHAEIFGKMVPVSESEVDVAVESAAIEWTHLRASELNIILKENGNETKAG